MTAKKPWTPDEDAILRSLYASTLTQKIADQLNRTASGVYQRARILGLEKDAEYLRTAGRWTTLTNAGAEHRFSAGIVPWNKGMKGWQCAGSKPTQFKRGNKPQTWKPIGSERIGKDGLLTRKYFDTGVKSVDWVAVHVHTWTQHNGPVPSGCVVCFADGNNRNFNPENLECITRAEMMIRNSVHNLPKELAELCQLRGALNRQISKRASK